MRSSLSLSEYFHNLKVLIAFLLKGYDDVLKGLLRRCISYKKGPVSSEELRLGDHSSLTGI